MKTLLSVGMARLSGCTELHSFNSLGMKSTRRSMMVPYDIAFTHDFTSRQEFSFTAYLMTGQHRTQADHT